MSLVGLESKSTMLPFLGSLGPRVHSDPHIGLGESGRIVGTVAGHGDQVPGRLFLANQGQFVFRSGFRKKVIHAGLLRDGGRRQAVVPVIMTVLIPWHESAQSDL